MARPYQLPSLALLGALCMGAGPARSPVTTGEVALEFRGLDGCPGEGALRERTADLFDFEDPFVKAGTDGRSLVRVSLSRDATHFRAGLQLLDPNGVTIGRTAEEHVNCDALVWLTAHRLRLLIIRATLPTPPPPPPPPEEVTRRLDELARRTDHLERNLDRLDRLEEKTEALEKKAHTLERQMAALDRALDELRRKNMNLTYTLSTGLLMTANLTSNVGPGVWVGGDLRFEPVSLGLELRAVLPARFEVGPYDTDLSYMVALLTPCGRYSVFFGCVVAGAGVEIDHDSNFDYGPATIVNPIVHIGGRVGVEIPLGESRFALRGWGEVLYSTPSTNFTYLSEDAPPVKASRPDVSAFFGLGLVVKLDEQGAK